MTSSRSISCVSNSILVIDVDLQPRNFSKKSCNPFTSPFLSFWSKSPVMTILEFSPNRVNNIFICEIEEFWISSAIIHVFLNVRPRIYANGAISICLSSNILVTSAGEINLYKIS